MGEQCADGGALDVCGVGVVGVWHTTPGDPRLYVAFAHDRFGEGLQHQVLGAIGAEVADHAGVGACGGATGEHRRARVMGRSGDESDDAAVVFGVFDERDAQRVLCVTTVDGFDGGRGIVHVETEIDEHDVAACQ